MIEEILKTVAPYIVTVVGLLCSWGVYELNQYIRAKTKNESIVSAIATLGEITKTTVKGLAQTTQGSLADGKFTKEEGAVLKKQAVDSIKAQITPALDKQLSTAVNNLENFVDSKIEAAVMDVKIEKVNLTNKEVSTKKSKGTKKA